MSCDIAILKQIKEIVKQPSKYDTIKACLQPCLGTKELEDANYACVNGSECSKCGFRRLWSNGLRKTLCRTIPMNDDAIVADTTTPETGGPDSAQPSATTLIPDAPLACDEWTKESIDWRYYTHQVAPTEGAHAQEVARQATAAHRANLANHTDAGGEEYQPSST